MIIFILGIAVLAVFFICIIGFAMAVGNVFSSLYTCIFGESETYSNYTFSKFSEDDSTPTQKPEGFLAASQRMSALQEKHRAETETAAEILPQPETIPVSPPLPKVKPRYRLPVDISDIQHMSVIHMTDEQFARYMSHFQQASDNRRRYIDSLH